MVTSSGPTMQCEEGENETEEGTTILFKNVSGLTSAHFLLAGTLSHGVPHQKGGWEVLSLAGRPSSQLKLRELITKEEGKMGYQETVLSFCHLLEVRL